jgi:hypothetical protein
MRLLKEGGIASNKIETMELFLQISKLEVFVPENLYEPKTMALCI